jgi:hypothetical protein
MNADLRYPIGKAQPRQSLTPEERPAMIEQIAGMPARLKAAVSGLNAAQLDTPYRPGGWTVRQVVHHYADSHMNSFVRFKLALTEDSPTIKPYNEKLWAETPDAKNPPIDLSLGLIEGLHARWVLLLRSMAPQDWARKMTHPERGVVTLDENLCIYSWHSLHHVAHITALREREGWS